MTTLRTSRITISDLALDVALSLFMVMFLLFGVLDAVIVDMAYGPPRAASVIVFAVGVWVLVSLAFSVAKRRNAFAMLATAAADASGAALACLCYLATV